VVLSGLGFLKHRRGPRRDRPSARLVAAGVIVMAASVIVGLLSLPSDPEPDVNSPIRFSSSAGPALALDAPPGWALTADLPQARLSAVHGASSLRLDTSVLSDKVDAPGFFKVLSDRATAAGAIVDGSFTDTFDGLAAPGIATTNATAASVIWYVPRGGQLVTVLVCTVPDVTAARATCRGLLASLRWRPPNVR
jgi:hypothetical protein